MTHVTDQTTEAASDRGAGRRLAAMPRLRAQAELEPPRVSGWRRAPAASLKRSSARHHTRAEGAPHDQPGRPRIDLALIGLLGLWCLLVIGLMG